MSVLAILVISGIIFFLAYRFYGRFVGRKLGMSDDNITPAHTLRDDVDYVPTKAPIVLGHHFASIAGAGPIVGPVIAVAYGWIPALLWIVIGSIFFGAVHDLTSMVASLRHEGKSIGTVIEQYIGKAGKKMFLIFSFSTLILVIAVFADIVAKTFAATPSAAGASVYFILAAVAYGFLLKRFSLPVWVSTLIGVTAMVGLIALGIQFPVALDYTTWLWILFGYIFIAAITPVWALLQPRDYLNSFMLYGMMLGGLIGVLILQPTVEMSSSVTFNAENLGYLFPVLFVTIACGAISGFHSLVASGTTSKQIDTERDAMVVGYGGMLIEGMLAVLAVCAVVVMDRGAYIGRLAEVGPVQIFSEGLGGFIASLGFPAAAAVSFVALTVSAFALTSLDTCTRLARFSIQEYFEHEEHPVSRQIAENRYLSTFITVIVAGLLVVGDGFATLWPMFGSANQLLGALALLTVTVWLFNKGVNPLFTLIPMVFMFTVTISSLAIFAWQNFQSGSITLTVLSVALLGLSFALIILARKSLSGVLGSSKGLAGELEE